MSRSSQFILAAVLASAAITAYAQAAPSGGILVVIPASKEIVVLNDEAHITLTTEEQDKDKAIAASLVNKKMKEAIDLVKKQDPQARLKTRGYYTYAVYAEDAQRPNTKPRPIVAWRAGEYLDVTTTNLEGLPTTVAAVQGVLALNNLQFGLSPAAVKKMDADLITATYKNLTERITSIAAAMGRRANNAVIETVDFEGSGNYTQNAPAPKAMAMRAMSDASAQEQVAEPNFEPGESSVGMRLVGKVRFW